MEVLDMVVQSGSGVRQDVSVHYVCPVCEKRYTSRDEAERCAAPRKPKFGLEQWVMAEKSFSIANPAFDDWYGGEDPYIEIKQGSIARICGVSDENKVWGQRCKHPEFVYLFDRGMYPLSSESIRERYLVSVTPSALERVRERSGSLAGKKEDLDALLMDIEKDVSG